MQLIKFQICKHSKCVKKKKKKNEMNKQHRFEISLITTLKLSTSPTSKDSLQIIFNLLLTLKPYYVDFLSDSHICAKSENTSIFAGP